MRRESWHEGVRVNKVPESGAKRAMLEAALVLVAARGFDPVSIRDVTQAARANVAAVNYHFGGREGLMALLITHVAGPLCEERSRHLGSLGKQSGVGSVLNAYLNALPSAAARIGMERALFFRLAGRIGCLPEEALPGEVAKAMREVDRDYLTALEKAVAESAGPELAVDWTFFRHGVAQSLVAGAEDRNISGWMARWVSLGEKALGGVVAAKPKNDPQGLLFDF